ncbi:MAG TPA: molybdopterin-dependent oxidoreductase [Candidatus Nanopelagicales bacterium]|nr:molybdopterin-dependent oxidoreductase [Candidatus Nanopelagicales bacterium]
MRTPRWLDAARGVLALLLGVGSAHLLAALTDPARSPLAVAGSVVVRSVPTWLEQLAVQRLGNADKPVLVATLGLALIVAGALAGLLSRRSRAAGTLAILAIASLAVLAAALPPGGAADTVPSLVGALVAVGAFLVLTRRAPEVDADAPEQAAVGRRGVLLGVVGAGALAAIAAGSGEAVRRGREAQAALQRAVRLPRPADPAPALPADVEVGVADVTPFRVPVGDFYRVDTALVVPQVDPATWSLQISGMVREPFTVGFDELLAMPLVERDLTLTCVSNEVGGPYVGNQRWLGVRLVDLMKRAGIDPRAEQLLSRSVDGWSASTPVSVALDGRDALVAVGMDGAALPAEHGFPARLVVPGLYGFVSATKWLTEIVATTYAAEQAYWTVRGWATDAPVRTMARIDVPRPLTTVRAGQVAVAGVAWAQHRGVQRVEVQVDDGAWSPARLGGAPSDDTWRQWVWAWDAAPGRHTLRVRTTDGTGEVQPADRLTPFPSGAQGRHEVVVQVA